MGTLRIIGNTLTKGVRLFVILASHPGKIVRVLKYIYHRDLSNYFLLPLVFCFSWAVSATLVFAATHKADRSLLTLPHIVTVPSTLLFAIYTLMSWGKKDYMLDYVDSLSEYYHAGTDKIGDFIRHMKGLILHLSTYEHPSDVSVLVVRKIKDDGMQVVHHDGVYGELLKHDFSIQSVAGQCLDLQRPIVESDVRSHPHLDKAYQTKVTNPDKHIQSILAIPLVVDSDKCRGCIVEFISPKYGVFVDTKETNQLIKILQVEFAQFCTNWC